MTKITWELLIGSWVGAILGGLVLGYWVIGSLVDQIARWLARKEWKRSLARADEIVADYERRHAALTQRELQAIRNPHAYQSPDKEVPHEEFYCEAHDWWTCKTCKSYCQYCEAEMYG